VRIPLRHEGEVDWRRYRHSINQVLPHYWRAPEDTTLKLSTFHKNRKRTDKSASTFHKDTTGLKFDIDIDSILSSSEKPKQVEGNVIVAFLHDSIEVLQVGRLSLPLSLSLSISTSNNLLFSLAPLWSASLQGPPFRGCSRWKWCLR
jgi:hypothetical protein